MCLAVMVTCWGGLLLLDLGFLGLSQEGVIIVDLGLLGLSRECICIIDLGLALGYPGEVASVGFSVLGAYRLRLNASTAELGGLVHR